MTKYLYALGRTFLGGFSNSVGRLVLNTLPLYPFIFIRHFFIALISLFIHKEKNHVLKDLAIIKNDKRLLFQIITSCTLSGAGTILFYNALKVLPVNLVSIFDNGVFMLFTVFLSVIFLKEAIAKKSICYIGLCIFGLALIVTNGNFGSLKVSVIGFLLLIFNSFLSAVEITITASSLKRISAATNTAFKSLASALVALFLAITHHQSFVHTISLLTLPLVLFILYSIVSGFLIKYLQSRSIQVLTASKTAIFQILTPVFSSLFGMIIFHDWFTWVQFIGLFAVVYAVYKLK